MLDTQSDKTNTEEQMMWPFPPPTGPVPWTKKQEQEYKRKMRDQAEEAPL